MMNAPISKHFDEDQEEIYSLLQELLHAIKQGDADTYTRLTSEALTCVEPETGGHKVHGLPFHLFLVERTKPSNEYHIEIVDPTIRVYDNTAYATYTLANSTWDDDTAEFHQVQETRIFHRKDGIWKMVHFHRSETS